MTSRSFSRRFAAIQVFVFAMRAAITPSSVSCEAVQTVARRSRTEHPWNLSRGACLGALTVASSPSSEAARSNP